MIGNLEVVVETNSEVETVVDFSKKLGLILDESENEKSIRETFKEFIQGIDSATKENELNHHEEELENFSETEESGAF